MSSRRPTDRNIAAIDRRIEQKLGRGQVITGIAEVVTEDGRAARVRLIGSGVLTDVAIVRGAQINPGDHVILLRPTDNDQWVCLGGYVRRVVSTQGATSLNDITGLSDPNNLQVFSGPGLLFCTWDSPPQRPDLTWLVQVAELSDNQFLNPVTYSRGGSTLVITGVPGQGRHFRIRAVDRNWNRSEWSATGVSGVFGALGTASGSGSGASTFISLLDTPSTYTGNALKYLRVSSMMDGVEFVTFPDHDHSGDTGDGGKFNAANLTSGAASDGYVLTAGGDGTAFWAEQEDPHAFHDNQTAEFQGLTEKSTLSTSDVFVIEDSLASYTKKKVYANNLGVTDSDAIHDNVSGEINAVTEKASPSSTDVVLIEDSEASYAKKRVQLGNLPGGSGTDEAAIHDNVSAEISAITEKTTPVDNDLLLIEDSEASNAKKSLKIGNLPGGGITSYDDSWDSGPAGNEGDLWIPQDSLLIHRFPATGNGLYRGPLFDLTIPDMSFSWVNQGTADVDDGLPPTVYLYDQPSGMHYRCRVRSQPTIPYQVTAGLMPLALGVNYSMFGIGWRESSTGRLALFRIFYGSGWEIQANYASDTETDIGTYYGTYLGTLPSLVWMRIRIQDGYRYCEYSVDGFHFIQIHSIAYDNYIEPNQVLFFINPYQSTHDVGVTLVSWKEEEL